MNTELTLGKKVAGGLLKQKALLVVIILLVYMAFGHPEFFSSFNLMDMLKQASVNEIIAFGITIVIICGACDLSVGGTMCVSGILAILLMNVLPMWIAILAAVGAGALIGFINGFFVVKQRTEPFIITLGMGMLLKGVCQQLTDAKPIQPGNQEFMQLANGKVFGIVPNIVVVMILAFIAVFVLLRYTAFGRNCYAIGGDYSVAQYSGINVIRTKWVAFVLSGVITAVAGVMLSSLMNSGASTYGDNTAMLVNCGVVVGGTSFAGGIGGVWQSALGMFVLVILSNCMNLMGIDPYVQQAIQGIVIVAIIWLDCYTLKRARETV